MSIKTEKIAIKDTVWRWYVAFDDLDIYDKVAEGLQEMSEFQGGEMVKCPDGESRMTIEVKKEFLKQFETVRIGGEKIRFQTMIKRQPDGDFEFVPTTSHKKLRVSEPLFQIIRGSSLLRRQQRHSTKSQD